MFRPRTIKTIIETAPLVIQGTGKLIEMIREKEANKNLDSDQTDSGQPLQEPEDAPLTMESLNRKIKRLDRSLKENSESDIEQIKLIEQLARQNEALAESVNANHRRITTLTIISALALVVGFIAVLASFISA